MAKKPPISFDCEGVSDAAREPSLRDAADALETLYSAQLELLEEDNRDLSRAAAKRYRSVALAHTAATTARTARDAAILEGRSVTDAASLNGGIIPMRKLMSTDIAEREIRAEIAVLLRISENAAAFLISDALLIATAHPTVCDSLADGRISDRHATALVRTLSVVPEERRAGVVADALPLAERMTPPQFARRLRVIVDKALTEPLAVRHRAAVEERHVRVFPMDDGMGMLEYYDSIENVLAVQNRLDHMADTSIAIRDTTATPVATPDVDPDGSSDVPAPDIRTRQQVRTDILRDLLLDGETDVLPEELLGIRPEISLLVPVSTAMGGDEPGHLDGYGPIDADTARELCANAPEFTRILTNPDTGAMLSLGRETYRPPRALRRYLRRRDGTCRFPGCTRPAVRAEIDHITAWAVGGTTDADNLECLCAGHHTVKHATVVGRPHSRGCARVDVPNRAHHPHLPHLRLRPRCLTPLSWARPARRFATHRDRAAWAHPLALSRSITGSSSAPLPLFSTFPPNRQTYGQSPYTFGMASPLKSDRLDLRLTAEQKREIERAAAISGRSVTDFSVSVLAAEAAEVIRQDRELRMSAASWDIFRVALDQPAQPITELADLLRRPSVFS